jgi:CARDB protein
MRALVWPLPAAVVAISLVALPADGARSAAPRCAASYGDVLCVVHPLVRLGSRRTSPKVKAGTARGLKKATTITLTKKGLANLFLGRAAQCQDLSLTRRGTALRTRVPHSSLFTQYRGTAYCTMADGRIAVVKAGSGIKAPSVRASAGKKTPFSASLEAAAPAGGATEFRMHYYPRQTFVVATRLGQLRVRLSNQAPPYLVPAGSELGVGLRPDQSIAWVKVRPASFSASEDAIFGKQLELPDLTVTVLALSQSCAGGSCSTTIRYTVGNIGRVASPGFDILLEADPDLGVTRTVRTKPVFPDKPRTLSTRVGPDGDCFDPDCSVRVTVDPKNSVLETTDKNNVDTLTVGG